MAVPDPPASPQPIGDVAKDVVGKDTTNGDRPGKTSVALGGPSISRVGVIAAAVGVVALAGVGGGVYLATHNSAGAPAVGPVSTPNASASPTTSTVTSAATPQAQQAFLPNIVFDGCVAVQPQGSTTTLMPAFTISNPIAGNYTATFMQGPSGPVSGTGHASGDPGNPVVTNVSISSFGDYSDLRLQGPDGKAIDPGPLAARQPISINAGTDHPNDCAPSALHSPPAPGSAAEPQDRFRAYLAIFAHQLHSGDAQGLASTLNPAVVARYGAGQCARYATSLTDPTAAFAFDSIISGPGPYQYTSSGLTTTVPNVYVVHVDRVNQGRKTLEDIHLALEASQVSWFGSCGTPVGQ